VQKREGTRVEASDEFSSEEVAGKKVTRREHLFVEMEEVVLWSEMVELIEPSYPRGVRSHSSRSYFWSFSRIATVSSLALKLWMGCLLSFQGLLMFPDSLAWW